MAQIITSGRARPALQDLLDTRAGRRQEDAQNRRDEKLRGQGLKDLEASRAYEERQQIEQEKRDLATWKEKELFKKSLEEETPAPIDEKAFGQTGLTGMLARPGQSFSFTPVQMPEFSRGIGVDDPKATVHFRATDTGELEYAVTTEDAKAATWDPIPRENSEAVYSYFGVNYPWQTTPAGGAGAGKTKPEQYREGRQVLFQNSDDGRYRGVMAQNIEDPDTGKTVALDIGGERVELTDPRLRTYSPEQVNRALGDDLDFLRTSMLNMPFVSIDPGGQDDSGAWMPDKIEVDGGWIFNDVKPERVVSLLSTVQREYENLMLDSYATNPSSDPTMLTNRKRQTVMAQIALAKAVQTGQWRDVIDLPVPISDPMFGGAGGGETVPFQTYLSESLIPRDQ